MNRKPPAAAVLRPQRLLAQVQRDAERMQTPSGVGLDSSSVRQSMVRRLAAAKLASPTVLAAMEQVPRQAFVDSAFAPQAYEDTSLPIGFGQTISKPSVVARMLELLLQGQQAASTQSLGRVLEIGTGCGYQAAVLACLARQVVSVERIEGLHVAARQRLQAWQASHKAAAHLTLLHGDGRLGAPRYAPFDSIIAAAGGEDLPEVWLQQMAPGGRLVAPVERKDGRGQALVVVDCRYEHGRMAWSQQVCESVAFVPLKSGLV